MSDARQSCTRTAWNDMNQNPLIMLRPGLHYFRYVSKGRSHPAYIGVGEKTYNRLSKAMFLRLSLQYEKYHDTGMGLFPGRAHTPTLLRRFSSWHRPNSANRSVKPVFVSASIPPLVQSVQIAHATYLWVR